MLRNRPMTLVALLLCAGWLAASASEAHATPVAYWRMEVDTNPDPNGLSVPNELAFGTPLVSSEAVLDGVNLPAGVVPLSMAPNNFSLGASQQGGSNGINASAAWYPELVLTSLTVEFWARTQESVATPLRWTTGGADGIVLTDPNSLDLTFHVDIGGTPTAFSMNNLDNMDASWSHYAFLYDEVAGLGEFWIDGTRVRSVSTAAGSPLVLVPGTPLELGVLMDFASADQGTLDELKIHDEAIPASQMLLPEPSTSLALVLSGLLVLRRRRS